MALEMKTRSKWWYGRYRDGDKVQQFRLDVQIKGTRPTPEAPNGDRAFRASRDEALVAFHKQMEKRRSGNYLHERTVQQLARIKTGRKIAFPRLEELPALWTKIPRRAEPSRRHVERCQRILTAFVAFVEKEQPAAKEFVTVTPETARRFMDAEQARGVAPKTWNDTLKLLRTTFRHLHPQLTEGSNPFHGLVTKTAEGVRREPYSVEELQFILAASEEDPFIHPIIVLGVCTAMRRGDCCLLTWEAVDLEEGFITVKTSKTGETVDIPLFPMLRALLVEEQARAQKALPKRRQGRAKEPEGYVFPGQAAMCQSNPDGITWRVKKVINEAFKNKAMADGDIMAEGDPKEVRRRAKEYLDSLGDTPRAPRMRKTFRAYMSGKNINEVAEATGQTKASVSNHLNQIEEHIGLAFIRGKVRLVAEPRSLLRHGCDSLEFGG